MKTTFSFKFMLNGMDMVAYELATEQMARAMQFLQCVSSPSEKEL